MLVDGKWVENWQPVQSKDEQGRFVRQVSSFRHWVTPDGSAGPTGEAGFKAESGRYRLYVAYICPWASRTLMARALKGLEHHVPITVVNPTITDQGWQFGNYDQADQDPYLTPDTCTRFIPAPMPILLVAQPSLFCGTHTLTP